MDAARMHREAAATRTLVLIPRVPHERVRNVFIMCLDRRPAHLTRLIALLFRTTMRLLCWVTCRVIVAFRQSATTGISLSIALVAPLPKSNTTLAVATPPRH